MSNNTRITELEALNTMLETIGSSAITNIDSPQNADALAAKGTLRLALKEVQSEKWWFNTEYNYPLIPNSGTGEITIPVNITHIDYTGRFGDYRDLVIRGSRLYDKDNHTFIFTSTIYVNIRLSLEFDEIPEVAKLYVIMKACRKFQDQMQGDNAAHQFTREDEGAARSNLVAEDIRQTKPSFGVLPRIDPNVGLDMRNI